MDLTAVAVPRHRPRLVATRRSSRVSLHMLAGGATIVQLTTTRAAPANGSTGGDSDDTVGSSVNSDGDTNIKGGAQSVMNALQHQGDAVLIRRKRKFWSAIQGQHTCDKAPFVFSRDGPSNNNCLPPYSQLGFSCTCLDGFDEDSPVWEFHVATKKRTTGTPATTVARTSILNITMIAPFVLPIGVKTVRIIGQDPSSSAIEFLPDVSNKGSLSTSKLRSEEDSEATLTSVYFENVDMSGAITNPNFFSPSLTNITLRNCNLKDGSTAFLTSINGLVSINLENNALTKFPSEVFGLSNFKRIYLRGNHIANVSLTEAEFQAINAAEAVDMDIPTSLEANQCDGGTMKTTKGIPFCVTNASDKTTADARTSSSSGSNTNLLIGVLSGCAVVVVILIFFIVRRGSSRGKEDAFVKQQTQSLLEDTMSFVQSTESQQPAINASLLNDPIIITHRIPYNDVKVATCISRGGFGLVYSGTFNRRRVAIKRIRSDLSADIKYIEAFLKEICLMASLNHPRIVEFVGVAWDSLRNLSAVTEFMERGDLRDVLHGAKTRNARLTWDGHKVRIAMHIAEALTYLHSLSPKVIHRDLKSKNVLLDSDMTAKLSDFGVSRERRFEETHMTAGVGTAFWIAPEVLLGMDYDERADIFSFGVVLSEIDTDDYPYWNEANPALGGKQQENVILRMVATGALRPEFSPECPSSILELAHACLDVDPAKRPTAAEIAYRLQQLMRSSPLTADVSVVLSPNEETKRSSV